MMCDGPGQGPHVNLSVEWQRGRLSDTDFLLTFLTCAPMLYHLKVVQQLKKINILLTVVRQLDLQVAESTTRPNIVWVSIISKVSSIVGYQTSLTSGKVE